MRVSTVLLLLSLLCLSSLVLGFNPYADDDETGKGAAPATTTVTCSVGGDGVEVCESVARTNIPDEEELAAKVEAAEAERIATMEAKAKARAERNAKIDADKAARREARDKERQAKKEKQENKEQEKKHHDLFDKSKLPGAVKKMKVNYYKFFGVSDDAKKMEIRRVANNMALANHPDKCPDRDDAKCIAQRKEKMIIINEAREVLLSDEKRPKYDFLLNFGFKVFDEELYNDVKKDFDAGEEIVGGWGEDRDPSSDFSTMQLSEEAAGWVLLFCGSVAAALLAWPVWKFWEARQGSEAKKLLLKKNLQSSLSKGQEKMASMKKKTEKFTGEKTVKRFDASQ